MTTSPLLAGPLQTSHHVSNPTIALDHIKIKEAILQQSQTAVVSEYRQIMTLDVPPHDRMHRNIHVKATQLRTLPPLLPSRQVPLCQNMAASIHTQRGMGANYQQIIRTVSITIGLLHCILTGTVWSWKGLKLFQSAEIRRLVTAIPAVNLTVLGKFFKLHG